MLRATLVTGGTGTTGSRVAAHLSGRGLDFRIGTRTPSGLADVRFDWADATSWPGALTGVKRAYLVAPSGETDLLPAMTPFLTRAIDAGVERFVLLSASSLSRGGPMMGAVHAWLHDYAPEWRVLRPTWFMQNFASHQHLASIRDKGVISTAAQDGRVPFIDADDIAAVATEALTRTEFVSGDDILTGPEALSYDDVAQTLTTILGRPIRHERLSVAQLQARHEALGLPPDYAALLAAMDGHIAAGSEDRVTDTVRRVIGRNARRFAEFASDNAGIWRKSGG